MPTFVRALALLCALLLLTATQAAQSSAGATALAALRQANALHQLDAQALSRLSAEFSQFKSCIGGRQIRINEIGDARAINILVTKEAPGKTVKCGHGAACYDSDADVIFLDYGVVYAPFVSRQVGTSWISRGDDDNRVRLYRQLVFLHELGHKLKHAAEKSPSPDRRRAMEDEADAFAFQCLVESRTDGKGGNEDTSVDAAGTVRSRVKPPRARTREEFAALQIAEVVTEAGFALAYADQVSPFKATGQYRSFIDRSRGLLRSASARVADQNVAAYIAVARENLDRMGLVAGTISADVRDERIGRSIVRAAFDRLGFVVLGEDGTLLRLPYSTLELARGGNTIEPVAAALDEVCRAQGQLEQAKDVVDLVFANGEALLWRKGVGILACVDGTWRTERTWQERADNDWVDVISSPGSDPNFLVIRADGSLELHSLSKIVAAANPNEFALHATRALGLAPCEVLNLSSTYSRRAVMLRCGPARTEAVCALLSGTLKAQDCRLLPQGNGVSSGFHQAGVFAFSDTSGHVQFFTAASNFEPFAPRKEPWQIGVLSFSAEGGATQLAAHELVEERIPRGQDVLQWLSVVHPPLLFCGRTPTFGLICWADRDSAYYFDMETRTLRAVFHPADRVPLVGNGFIGIRGRGRYYVLEIAK